MLKEKTAIITGGSRGIGSSIAKKFASQGCNVAIIDYSGEENALQIQNECSEYGVTVKAYQCNVASFEQCKETTQQIIKDFGTIDILVNNAGITRDKLVLQMSEEDFESVVDINLKGTFNMIKCCYHTFMKKRYGKIINLSSVAGVMGNPGQANYSASKAGVIGLTKSVAKELASRNVCCNAIAPGFIATNMTESFQDNEKIVGSIPLKRMGKVEDVANLAAFLADDLSDYITGEVIRIDGGLAM